VAPAEPRRAPVVITGSVRHRTPKDSVPVGGVMVVLHRIGKEAQGPIDSVPSDALGRFRLRFRADTGAIYLVSARYLEIEYFAPPLLGDAPQPDSSLVLMVYDTASATPLDVGMRHVVVGDVDQTGSRAVADLVLINNPGIVTRTAGDSLHPSWTMRLPLGAQQVELGDGDFGADAVARRNDTLLVFASIPPGQRALTLTYRIPGNLARFEIPIDRDMPVVDVLTEDDRLVVRGGLALRDTMTVAGRHFTKWEGAVRGGDLLVLDFSARSGRSTGALPALIALLGLGLLGVGVAAFRRAPVAARGAPARPRQISPEADALLDRLAALDAAHAGGPGNTSAAEWQAYREERARLKEELAGLLQG
jgi:hypothetical protein